MHRLVIVASLIAVAAPARAQGVLEAEVGNYARIAVSADGGTFVVGGETRDGWRISTFGAAKRTQTGPARAVAQSVRQTIVDARRFMTTVDTKITFHALDTGKVIATGEGGFRKAPTIAVAGPAGAPIAAGYDDVLIGFDDRTYAVTRRLALLPLEKEVGRITALAYAPDGKYVAVGTSGHFVYIVDAATWKIARALPRMTATVEALAYHAKVLAVGLDTFEGLVLFDPATGGALEGPAKRPQGSVKALAFTPDGAHLAVAGGEYRIRVYATAAWKQRVILDGHSNPVSSLAWSGDGIVLASATDTGELRLWAPFE